MKRREIMAIGKLVWPDGPTKPAIQGRGTEMKFGAAPVEETSALEGKAVFIRTVTHHYTGRVVALTDRWLVIDDAAWIADDGRFGECLANGTPSEVEPFPDGAVWIGVGAILDVSEWRHPLPRTVK